MDYNLSQLVGWTRRSGGDVITIETETVTSDGSRRFKLNNDGYVNVRDISIDTAELASSAFESAGAVITLDDAPEVGASIDVSYDHATYSDEEILACITDAAQVVMADVKQTWRVDPANSKVVDDTLSPSFYDSQGRVDVTLPKLIVFRAAVSVYMLKAFRAADDAIMIKDGDTTINTSLTAKATDGALRRLQETYVADLRRYRSERFCGAAQSDAWLPFNVIVKHRDDGTLFFFNY